MLSRYMIAAAVLCTLAPAVTAQQTCGFYSVATAPGERRLTPADIPNVQLAAPRLLSWNVSLDSNVLHYLLELRPTTTTTTTTTTAPSEDKLLPLVVICTVPRADEGTCLNQRQTVFLSTASQADTLQVKSVCQRPHSLTASIYNLSWLLYALPPLEYTGPAVATDDDGGACSSLTVSAPTAPPSRSAILLSTCQPRSKLYMYKDEAPRELFADWLLSDTTGMTYTPLFICFNPALSVGGIVWEAAEHARSSVQMFSVHDGTTTLLRVFDSPYQRSSESVSPSFLAHFTACSVTGGDSPRVVLHASLLSVGHTANATECIHHGEARFAASITCSSGTGLFGVAARLVSISEEEEEHRVFFRAKDGTHLHLPAFLFSRAGLVRIAPLTSPLCIATQSQWWLQMSALDEAVCTYVRVSIPEISFLLFILFIIHSCYHRFLALFQYP